MLDFPSFLAGFLTGVVGVIGAQMWGERRAEMQQQLPPAPVQIPREAALTAAPEEEDVEAELALLGILDDAVHGWLDRTQGEAPEA